MTEGQKKFVTIKIPEETRDAAREDDRTYEAIMQAGLDRGAGDAERESVDVDELLRKLDQIQSAQGDTVEEALNLAEYGIESEEIAREVWRQADEAMIDRVVRNAIQSELG